MNTGFSQGRRLSQRCFSLCADCRVVVSVVAFAGMFFSPLFWQLHNGDGAMACDSVADGVSAFPSCFIYEAAGALLRPEPFLQHWFMNGAKQPPSSPAPPIKEALPCSERGPAPSPREPPPLLNTHIKGPTSYIRGSLVTISYSHNSFNHFSHLSSSVRNKQVVLVTAPLRLTCKWAPFCLAALCPI